MSTTPHKINLEELDTVSGGSRPDWLHDKKQLYSNDCYSS